MFELYVVVDGVIFVGEEDGCYWCGDFDFVLKVLYELWGVVEDGGVCV